MPMNDAIYNHRALVRSPTIVRKDITEANRNEITAFFTVVFFYNLVTVSIFSTGVRMGKWGPIIGVVSETIRKKRHKNPRSDRDFRSKIPIGSKFKSQIGFCPIQSFPCSYASLLV